MSNALPTILLLNGRNGCFTRADDGLYKEVADFIQGCMDRARSFKLVRLIDGSTVRDDSELVTRARGKVEIDCGIAFVKTDSATMSGSDFRYNSQ